MPTTVTTLMSRIRRRIEDSQGVHWSDAEVIGAINEGASDRMNYSLSEIIPEFPTGSYDILLVSAAPQVASVTADNRPIPLFKQNFEELYRRGRGYSLFYGDNITEGWGGASDVQYFSAKYATQGDKMFLDPIPRSDIQLRFEIIRRFREFDEGGLENTQPVFSNEEKIFDRYTRVIEYAAAIILKGRSDEENDPNIMQVNHKFSLMNSWLDQQSGSTTPRVVINGY